VSGRVELDAVVSYLDRFLRVGELPDYPNAVNGLQVENRGQIARIVAAVDASLETIEAAGDEARPTLLLVHHGLLWDGNVPLTGRRLRRLRALLGRDTALYASHLPLDVHPHVGNNAVLAARLGVRVEGTFGSYKGTDIGVWGHAPSPVRDRKELVEALDRLLGTTARLIPGGPNPVRRIGIVTGAAGDMTGEARAAGLDTFVTGEGPHHTYFDAMEWGLNLIYAGHYATEQLGVQTLAEHLSERFGLPWEFHRHPTGL